LRDWSQKFGVSPEQLKKVVGRVGPMADDVERGTLSMQGGHERLNAVPRQSMRRFAHLTIDTAVEFAVFT
jgi:hypothetical protein